MENVLTHLFPMHPFSTPWKHQKTDRICFQGVEKGCIGDKWVKEIMARIIVLRWLKTFGARRNWERKSKAALLHRYFFFAFIRIYHFFRIEQYKENLFFTILTDAEKI